MSSTEPSSTDPSRGPAGADQRRIMVIGPDGQPVEVADLPAGVGGETTGAGDADPDGNSGGSAAEMIGEPAKVMRIGTMIKQLLEEVRAAPLDEASRMRLKEIHTASIKELEEGLAPDLRDELERLTLPFTEDSIPSDAELRIAQAQLVGWLEGVFHGLQTAIFAQQMAARSQLEQMRRGILPPGQSAQSQDSGLPTTGTGQYL